MALKIIVRNRENCLYRTAGSKIRDITYKIAPSNGCYSLYLHQRSFGEGWGSFRIAHLSTGDKIGFEIFQFQNAEQRQNNFEYWKTGVFHFCVQDPDVEGLAAKIVKNGGKQRMPVRQYYPGEKPYRMVYYEDPFGNLIEIYSHSYELTYSAGAYQDKLK